MLKYSKKNNDDINLIELMFTLWEGKWKIAAVVVISLIAAISLQSTKTKNFTAITEIKPISTLKLNNFFMINSLIDSTKAPTIAVSDTDANTIEKDAVAEKSTTMSVSKLLNLYFDILNDRTVFVNAIRKFNLLENGQYNNEREYSEAIIKLASSIKILSPEPKKKNLEASYSTINFIHHDEEKWKKVLIYVDEFANKLVKKLLIEEYNNILLLLRNDRKHQLEDMSVKIKNTVNDYNREISDRMAYLEEQSAIALKLGIAKNTIEVQTFGNQNALLSNVKTDTPFYLRGYEAIDKEIELIKLRKDKKAFTKGLFELEKKKRAIEQDQTIERVEFSLQATLPAINNKFSAASINVIATKFEYKKNNLIVIAIVVGLIVGIFYVLISNAFQSHRVSRKKTN
ncbi:Wzz/FepE/Etk N-terminal domain-containing protein [Candidatus Pelagibacter sp.]|nr:Wzz/FepE/Etk N-terminal domain-containing protein [Candidatus Pelagibacter sp.]